MSVVIKKVNDKDKLECLRIEQAALPGVNYLDDEWNYFTSNSDGYFFGLYKDEKIIGFGKITVLYNKIGWLETIRIDPQYQGQGYGNEIYREYLKIIEQMKLVKVGLHTEFENYRSANLANKFNFKNKGTYIEYVKQGLSKGEKTDFKLVNNPLVVEQFYSLMDKFLIVNRTFYPVNKGLAQALIDNNWVYADNDGNLVVIGYRMQPFKAIHIPYFKGDVNKIILFAEYIASIHDCNKLSAFRTINDTEIKLVLEDNGFKAKDKIMTLWQEF